MVLDEGVHVVDEELYWSFSDDGCPVVFVNGILQEENKENENLLKTPRTSRESL
jgi:hypothetical protein